MYSAIVQNEYINEYTYITLYKKLYRQKNYTMSKHLGFTSRLIIENKIS